MTTAAELASYASSFPSFRNRIINGDMRIDQRNAGAPTTINTTANTYTLDRWNCSGNISDGVFTVDQVTDAPAGFVNSTKITVTTADASIGADESYLFFQFIEGNNVADLGFGTANAKTITVSFWVRSSLRGTFGGALNNSANDRNYPFVYPIDVADTWEHKTITIAGDTSGTWLTDTNRGIGLRFQIGVGSNRIATAGSWTGTSTIYGATGATNLISTLNATLYITGVQLEVGTVATPFEHRPISVELSLCKRYFEVWSGIGYNGVGSGGCVATNGVDLIYQFLVQKRSSVTATISAAGDFYIADSNWGSPRTCNSIGFLYATDKNVFIQARSASTNLTIGQSSSFGSNNTSNAKLNFSAEL